MSGAQVSGQRFGQLRIFCVAFVAAGFMQTTSKAEPSEEPPAKQCVLVRTETPYVPYGYNHIVVLKNTCDTSMACEVKTNVNPQVQKVTLAVDEEKRVTTFVGSPAREFTPIVTCKKR